MAEKAPPKPEKDAPKPEGAPEAGEKKKLPIKAIAIVGVIVLLEAVAVIGVAMRSGPSKAKAADAAHAEGDHAAAADPHAAKKDDGHGAKKDDGHGAKKDDGHGAKKDDGHGAKKDDGHGAKKDSGHGGGDKPAGPSLGPEDIAETLVVKEKFPNNQTGRSWLWDVEVYVQVRNKRLDTVTATLTTRSAEVKTGIARIWRTAQHAYFNEPGLETLTRQVREFLNGVVGQGSDGQPMIERVLIPRCVGFPTEF